MPPRRQVKGSRAKGAGPFPTPISSATTLRSPPEAEADDPINSLNIADLTLDVPIENKPIPKKPKPKPFRFMDLPVEVRLKVYAYHFGEIGPVVDIEHGNYFTIHRRLALFRVCRQIYYEAFDTFYNSKVFRIFPIDGRQARAKKGLLAKVKPQCRAHMTTLELRLGPGWSKPYRSWVVNDLLGLADCVNVRRLHVYIEIDPSDKIFAGWRKAPGFYENFCQNLLDDVLKGLPNAQMVQFDAHESVRKAGDMARGLLDVARANQRTICWGPNRGWTDGDDEDYKEPAPLASIVSAMAGFDVAPTSAIAQEVVA
ncbi:hypothetical protein N0V82_007108 [Gnomoniopsis sp. IMI 355080]|nr:hypothetical protein N0V82_007108 [Gnomoniopsis sp. IMI 355080]